ncbi:hypothetical protein [Fulvivirga lutea]|uniref:Uncharacterized protein n=1 Tax=Fulvivirga lutea TaxID=2810512 RepID=A0A974WF08_9BACT|nr:hypothetical protein [Fulvivirga lutea]QSE97244.1 hypothetical protein JR347_16885 [Fulvivirga lutea]
MKKIMIITLLISCFADMTAQEIVSRVNLEVKQNQMAAEIPKILIDAFSRGDIDAYYPKKTNVPVSYSQFLYHFGMTERAFRALMQTSPGWECENAKPVPVDGHVLKCMQYEFEIVEQMQRNNVTYEQERKLKYIRLVFSSNCTLDGVDVEGPVFKIADIADLTDQRYGVTNVQNPAVKYSILELLRLKLYSAN